VADPSDRGSIPPRLRVDKHRDFPVFLFKEVFALKVLLFFYCGKAKDLLAAIEAARRAH
jgi:hypothetical protein